MADGSCTDALAVGVGSHTDSKNTKDQNIQKTFVISVAPNLEIVTLFLLWIKFKKQILTLLNHLKIVVNNA